MRRTIDEIDPLGENQSEQATALLLINDAMFAFMGIVSRVMVENDLIGRSALADALEERAAPVDRDDHNPLLATFARSVRMNLPGGRFEVIAGGRSELDPG